ncbi:butyrophilin subfamily 1 member A1-like isoform X1 [Rhinatrema bivittatum]|uniref:butyrophilin subfamily 1 member A1-like isoform X1 n=1 Tax=Rhinatrema bivittatum TaxID=194408 RepID=UPI00112B5C54|nr:butyrophilin subfamily 1 member A1-like isoform X1 [Rhinatrema bivittatum]XP_029440657.1 butyrophilin subfamily 1 member A1-like isoform X1 [Rhinatrema bivittatum]XP_029440658.1 butyrophilin subfamily 1 member A1-like isoform X1 [Rhinatrema bivittatum]XP_029440659.1 butyrophilin subfamily 1 member A1-like isoform X1 [Rhinatrema bivittatum]
MRSSLSWPVVIIPFVLLHVHVTDSVERFSVVGLEQPLIAAIGEDAVLPCHLSPAVSAHDMEVRWFRSKFHAVVHLYRNGTDENDQQMPDFQGRTEFMKEDIGRGRVALRIRRIRLSDEGLYRCFFERGSTYDEAILELKTAGLGSIPYLHMEGHQGSGIRVVCRSSGWYPEPEVAWQEESGQSVPSASVQERSAEDGFFSVESVAVITNMADRMVSCRIRNALLGQEVAAMAVIAEPFFPRVSPWIVAFAITSLLFLGLTALAVWYNMKQRRQRGMLSRSRERLFNEVVWRRGVMNPEPVTLDPRTANPELIVSEDRKTASRSDVRQNLPDDEERFDTEYCVLGQHAFSHGRHYWEVEVGDGPEWAVGVARESVRRRGAYMFSPEEAIWCVSLFVDRYQVLTNPETSLELANRPRKLGVFLDFESGQLSFFNGEDRSLIYSFPEIFSGRILPFFWIGRTGTEIRLCH